MWSNQEQVLNKWQITGDINLGCWSEVIKEESDSTVIKAGIQEEIYDLGK